MVSCLAHSQFHIKFKLILFSNLMNSLFRFFIPCDLRVARFLCLFYALVANITIFQLNL